MPKRLTKAAKQNFEIREAFKNLCELINAGKLIETPDVAYTYHDQAKFGGAMVLYEKLYGRPETEVEP